MDAERFRAVLEQARRHPDRLLVGAAVGAGITAEAAQRGGADFLLALNAGRYRVMGAGSIACLLALGESNRLVMELACREILTAVEIPVLFGGCVFDPDLDLSDLVRRIRAEGFAGVANFPTAIHLGGRARRRLDTAGLGFPREAAFLAEARRQGLATVAYVRRPAEAERMLEAGADVLCINFGWNRGGVRGATPEVGLPQLIAEAGRIVDLVRRRAPRTLCLLEGGPIESPGELLEACRRSRSRGYIGGSTIERTPLEASIAQRTAAFKQVGHLRRRPTARRPDPVGQPDGGPPLIGHSTAIEELRAQVARLAQTRVPVLITGEPGTGKSAVADTLHRGDPARSDPLLTVDCLSFEEERLIAEVFGAEGRGGGVRKRSLGLAASDPDGTLLVQNLDRAPAAAQARLARLMLEGLAMPLGDSRSYSTRVRVLATAATDPDDPDATGRLSPRLRDAFGGAVVRIPPLRERLEDLPALVRHFLEIVRRDVNREVIDLDAQGYRLLMAQDWPGNTRQLRTTIERGALLAEGPLIQESHLVRVIGGQGAAAVVAPSPMSERDWILDALRRHRFRRAETARYLGVSRKTLYNKMRRYALFGEGGAG